MTIAELRKKEVEKLADLRLDKKSYQEDLRDAKRIMNSFYRLCALSERNCILANEENTCNLKSTEKSEQREYRWFKRLQKEFKQLYNLDLFSTGLYPRIGKKDARTGAILEETIYTYFY